MSPLECHVFSVACRQYPVARSLRDMTSWLVPRHLMQPRKWRSINLGASYRVPHLCVLFQHVLLPSPNETHRVSRERTTTWNLGFVISTWVVHLVYTLNKSRNYLAVYIKLNKCRKPRVRLKQIMMKRRCSSYEWRPTEFLLCGSSWLLKILRQENVENVKIAFYGILCTPRWQQDKLSIMIYLCNEQHDVK